MPVDDAMLFLSVREFGNRIRTGRLSPVALTEAYLDRLQKIGFGPPIIQAGNLAGQPALAIPNGFGPNNLPTGIQFTGKAWSEARLLSIAHAYQQATDWHTRRPTL